MMHYEARTSPMGRSFSNPLHLREVSLNSTGDESIFPTSTLSPRSDCSSSSDLISISWTARSGNSTNFLEDSVFGRSLVDENSMRLSFGHTDERESTVLGNWRKDQSITKPSWTNFKSSKEQVSRRTLPISKMFQMEQSNAGFMPITFTNFFSQRSHTPSPGISKMLLSLRDHAVKHPCTANASTLYQNTRTHCNPSELGQQTRDECMVFTKWANKLLQQSQDQFLITDLARDLGDGLTLLSLAGMLVGEYPPQVHIKPALDVQKIENVRTCLDFLQYYDVPVQDIAAVDIVKGNLKVVLALCHCLYRCFSPVYSSVHHLAEHNGVELFSWVSQVTGEPVTGFQSFEDGTVLWLLVNRILSNSVPDLVLKFGSPAEKVSSALKVSVEQLGIVTSIHADDIIKQSGQEKFLEFLNSLHLTYLRNTKTVQVDRSGSEGSILKRELKKLQTRDEKGKDNPLGSRLTYLGESSESRSLFSDSQLRCYFMKETEVPSAETEMTKQELRVSDIKVQNGTLNDTKRELDKLEKELRLLQLDYKSVQGGLFAHQSRASKHLQSPTSLLVRNARHIFDEKTELSPVLTYRSDEDGGKLSFGGYSLSEKHECFTQERRLHVQHQSIDDSFVFKEHHAKPSFLEKTQATASTQRKSCETVSRNRNEQASFGEEVRTSAPQRSVFSPSALDNCQLPQEFLVETKEISNIFDVEFSDLDTTLNNDREDKTVKRMLHVGKKITLDSTERESLENVRCGTGGGHSKGQQEPQRKPPTGQQRDTLSESRRLYGSSCDTLNFNHESVSNFSTPSGKALKESKNEFASCPSSSNSDPLNKPLAEKQFGTRNGIEPACHLQRTLSNEKRVRKEVLVKKSAMHSQPSSLKANTHALTALIRMSAKNAGASLSEES
ncbi:uncharacterized protein LOC141865551 isoform X2 [Acropora palmata]|uniref:uncharacterized protein LOC141865551 isoform X2 n=1 Tax=Acropora palmata TaxID=6131 RepID=UPI003D9FBC37